ncbi:esterase/lipase family protein [Psychromonas aquimarina]|uniref:esterase/lipase family protein n=1 Tax=Psychromonas aquimarina TaxID=444919 RepID=UPI000426328A|nr:hypothetical protein [Psychromonas aquimarina]
MQVIFVHGMGRSPLSGVRLLWDLKRKGFNTSAFAYMVSFSDFESIRNRLVKKVMKAAQKGEYVLIGHSLGGVLIRSALGVLPENIRRAPGRPIIVNSLASAVVDIRSDTHIKNKQRMFILSSLTIADTHSNAHVYCKTENITLQASNCYLNKY